MVYDHAFLFMSKSLFFINLGWNVLMKTVFVLTGNILLLSLITVVIIEKVYSHSFSPERQLLIAYTEIGLVSVLVIFYVFTIFYKHLRKR